MIGLSVFLSCFSLKEFCYGNRGKVGAGNGSVGVAVGIGKDVGGEVGKLGNVGMAEGIAIGNWVGTADGGGNCSLFTKNIICLLFISIAYVILNRE